MATDKAFQRALGRATAKAIEESLNEINREFARRFTASGIVPAPADETAQQAQPEGVEPGGDSRDAQNGAPHDPD